MAARGQLLPDAVSVFQVLLHLELLRRRVGDHCADRRRYGWRSSAPMSS